MLKITGNFISIRKKRNGYQSIERSQWRLFWDKVSCLCNYHPSRSCGKVYNVFNRFCLSVCLSGSLSVHGKGWSHMNMLKLVHLRIPPNPVPGTKQPLSRTCSKVFTWKSGQLVFDWKALFHVILDSNNDYNERLVTPSLTIYHKRKWFHDFWPLLETGSMLTTEKFL